MNKGRHRPSKHHEIIKGRNFTEATREIGMLRELSRGLCETVLNTQTIWSIVRTIVTFKIINIQIWNLQLSVVLFIIHFFKQKFDLVNTTL